MQLIRQPAFFALALSELPHNYKFIYATRFDSRRIVKTLFPVIGEHKFVVDILLASLLGATFREATDTS
jgi:hypothetical protein